MYTETHLVAVTALTPLFMCVFMEGQRVHIHLLRLLALHKQICTYMWFLGTCVFLCGSSIKQLGLWEALDKFSEEAASWLRAAVMQRNCRSCLHPPKISSPLSDFHKDTHMDGCTFMHLYSVFSFHLSPVSSSGCLSYPLLTPARSPAC